MSRRTGRLNLRLALLALLFVLSGLGLIARLAYVQIVDHGHYRAEAKSEHFGQQVIRAPRGALLDRDGYPLATTVDAYDLYIDRRTWRDLGLAQKAAAVLAPLVAMTPDELVLDVRKEEKGDYLLFAGVDFAPGAMIAGLEAPGLKAVA